MSTINSNSIHTIRAPQNSQLPITFNLSSSNRSQSNPLHQPMRTANGFNKLSMVNVLSENFMDPTPPNSVKGYDLSSSGNEVVKNLSTEVTCRSEQGIKGSSEQALQLKSNGRNVSVTFALNDESYDVLADNVVKMSKANIPVRIVAGDRATRTAGRENGTTILLKLLTMIQDKILAGDCDHSALIKLKLKVCYHDGSELQFMVEKMTLAQQYDCQLDEISIQLRPLDELEKSLEAITRYLGDTHQDEMPIVCYAIIFASDEAYENAPERIKKMAGHAFHDQHYYLRKLKSIVDRFHDASIRLSFFGFSKLHYRVKTTLLKQFYQALQ